MADDILVPVPPRYRNEQLLTPLVVRRRVTDEGCVCLDFSLRWPEGEQPLGLLTQRAAHAVVTDDNTPVIEDLATAPPGSYPQGRGQHVVLLPVFVGDIEIVDEPTQPGHGP